MFRRNRAEPATEAGRYRVTHVHSARSHDTLALEVQQAMNEGNDNGWHLLNVTQHAAVVLLYWDTDPV